MSQNLDIYSWKTVFSNPILYFQVAKENGTTLPSAALFVIRYHSFYRKNYC